MIWMYVMLIVWLDWWLSSFFFLLLDLSPVVLEGVKLDSLRADNQVVGKKNLEGQSGQEWGGSEQQAKQILLEAELDSLERSSSVLDHGKLDDNGSNNNNQEEFVVEEVFEDVGFIGFEFSCVDFVEDLEEHKDVEEDGVVLSGLVVPFSDVNGWRNAEELGTLIRYILP